MATGEGKTLVATLPLYLNALPGRGAHLVTVNYYLARRDSQWMGHVYRFLGLSVGCIDDTEPGTPERRAAYAADITYGTNNEFGFDYLRDNMVVHARAARAARPLVRDRRRGRLDPDRRGAHAAHHLGARWERRRRPLRRAQRGRCAGWCASRPNWSTGWWAKPRSDLAERPTREAAGMKLYQAQLGMPKNKRLLKLLQEHGRQGAAPAHGAGLHRRPQAARPSSSTRDLEEDLTSCSTRRATRCTSPTSGVELHVAQRPRAVHPARHLGGRCTGSSSDPR